MLARLLSPSVFGAYAYILFAQSLAKLLTDGGLTATLVRQTDEPEEHDWRSVFTFQTVLAVALAVVVLVTTQLFVRTFDDVRGFTLANALAVATLLVSPLLSVCLARLERALRYDKIGLLSLVQPLSFAVIAPLLAAVGLGIVALGAGILLSTVLSLLVALPFTGRPPLLTLHPTGLRSRFRFSAAYVGSGLLSTVKDAANPLLVGAVVGAAAVGYIRWSSGVAVLAVYLASTVGPMLFAVFARVQLDADRLGRATTLAVFWSNVITAPVALLLTIFIQPITTSLYGEKWLQAIPLFLLFALSNLISPTTTVLLALCNAIGRPTIPLVFVILWFSGTWIFTGILVGPLGAVGYGIANALVGLFGIALIVVAKRLVPHRVVRSIVLPWITALVSCVPAIVLNAAFHDISLAAVVVCGLVSLAIFTALIRALAPREFKAIIDSLRPQES